MDHADVDEAIEKAWKLWSDVIPLTFTRVYDDSADIKISFDVGWHGDSYPFDGKGCILAHADTPMVSKQEVHFNDIIYWTKDDKGNILFIVAAHEFGHTLGLDHSDVPGAVMSASYNNIKLTISRLPQDDIDGAQEVYDPPVNSPSVKNMIQPAEALLHEQCDAPQSLDAASYLGKEILAFKDRFVWRKVEGEKFVKYPISKFWPALSRGIDAAYEVRKKDTLYLFKDDKYWAVKENFTMPGFPKKIRSLGFPPRVEKIDAAFHDERTNKTYFFSGDMYWRYDEAENSMKRSSPEKITDFSKDLQKVDAALWDGEILNLFSGSEQYELHIHCSNVTQKISFLKSWFDCE